MNLKNALEARFDLENIQEIPAQREDSLSLLLIQTKHPSQARILMTNGLSNYTMPVDENNKGKEHVELYFCLPTYWEINDNSAPEMNWVFEWIQRLAKFVQEKNTWFAHGHTIPAGKTPQALSRTMLQDYFLFSDPILMENELKPLLVQEKTIHFLAVIPLFSSEWKMKTTKSTFYFLRKFKDKKYSELLDDFRPSLVKKGWKKWLP